MVNLSTKDPQFEIELGGQPTTTLARFQFLPLQNVILSVCLDGKPTQSYSAFIVADTLQ